jgi:hypothetical protein
LARAQETAPQLQTPPASPTRGGPIPVGLDGQLANWLQVRGEFRSRVEGFDGGGFATGNSDAYWVDRFRLNATVRPHSSLGFVVQLQDARSFLKTTGGQLAPFRDALDVRMAYGEYGTQNTIRIGRQELAFGEQRLLGPVSWLNTARTFDGARFTLKRAAVQVDVFGASVVTIQPDDFDRSGNGNALYGVYTAWSAWIPNQVVEPYFFWRESRGTATELGPLATLNQATTGIRMAGKLSPSVDYSTELALQTGSLASEDVKAWASHALVGKSLAALPWRPRVFGEFNHASGDTSKGDGRRGTFDQLYPTPHDKYGLADQVGWKNINHVHTGIELKPTSQWQVASGYHSWWLASATDGLYSAGGALVAKSATGVAGTHVGQEIDLQTTYTYSAQLQIGAGYAYLFPGEFLNNTTEGQAYSYPYVMATYVFLGEKPAISWRKSK